MRTTLLWFASLALVASSGCSILVSNELDEKGAPGSDAGRDSTMPGVDAGPGVDTGPSTDGGGEEVDCTMENDGTSCGTGLICIDMACVSSECGDGFEDSVGGEECDDGNVDSGDGCEPSCTFTCTDSAICDDGDVCNGAETCDPAAHLCMPGTPAMTGTSCPLGDGSTGVCRLETCVAPGCGNDVLDDGEDCDDGMNGDDSDGCRDDCTFTCTSDDQCRDADMCNGAETCDTVSHVCVDPPDLGCDDSDACTTDSCVTETGCSNVLVDGDGDGSAPETLGACGTDCDDTDPAIYQGATEYCDAIDNDCDGTVDETAVMATCYRDGDRDGYGHPTITMMACTCPTGWLPRRRDGLFDCADGTSSSSVHANVYPGQTRYFTSGYCAPGVSICLPNYDYNCDGMSTRQYTHGGVTSCSGFGTLCYAPGWVSTTIPSCGQTAEWQTCGYSATFGRCIGTRIDQRQACR